ncbi:MAG: secondary thiamine-phosphate synthase enzyme YjbQ [Bacteroidota bacterium]|nr:secondary thiamine-phosphate synthase enzyme YjbQ [Bacteroidota bacterium]
MVTHYALTLGPYSRGFHIITDEIIEAVNEMPQQGMIHVLLKHTSAGICINENADASVRHDFNLFFDKLAPENLPGLQHDMEGPDDMPAHIKSTLTGVTISIPIINRKLALGTWQGIYLCEFRSHARKRDLIISIIE